MIAFTLLIIIVVTLLVKYFLHMRRLESYVKHLPSPPSLPFIGSGHHLIGISSSAQLFNIINRFGTKLDSPYKSYLGPVLNIIIDKPEDMKMVLMSPYCHNKPYINQFLPAKFGLEAITSGDVWKPIRKLMNPSFNTKILQSFESIFNEKTKIMLEMLEKEIGNGRFDIASYMNALTLDMISATTMGFNVDVQRNKNRDFLESVDLLFGCLAQRFIRIWAHADVIYKRSSLYKFHKKQENTIFSFIDYIWNNKKIEYDEKHKNNIDEPKAIADESTESYKSPQVVIDQLLQLFYTDKLSERIIKEQIYSIITAGTETSATTISFVILLLAMYPDVQDRLFNELRSTYDTEDDDISYNKIKNLQYLDCVLKETMRLFPIIPFNPRMCSSDVQIKNCVIPKGSTIVLSIYHLHRRKDIWGVDANEFNPDNFLPENVSKRHASSFLPFTAGSRNCIGHQYAMISMKMVLVGILRKYKFTTNLKLSDFQLKFELTLKLANKHMVSMERRIW